MIAIRCFNVETGLIGENTKETGLLPIRMQWWRDAVNSVFRDTPVKHPVIQALAQVNQLGVDNLGTGFRAVPNPCNVTLTVSKLVTFSGASCASTDQV